MLVIPPLSSFILNVRIILNRISFIISFMIRIIRIVKFFRNVKIIIRIRNVKVILDKFFNKIEINKIFNRIDFVNEIRNYEND